MKKILLCALVVLAPMCVFAQLGIGTSGSCYYQKTPECTDTQTISASEGSIRVESNGGLAVSMEYVISGSPDSVSIVAKGCGSGGTCDTLDTYSTVANAVRNIPVLKPYAYYTTTATWSGGTSVSVKVNTRISTSLAYPGVTSSGRGINVEGAVFSGPALPTTNALAIYDLLAYCKAQNWTGNATAIVPDISGHGNHATPSTGTPPTCTANGMSFTTGAKLSLPAGVDGTARTFTFASYMPTTATSNQAYLTTDPYSAGNTFLLMGSVAGPWAYPGNNNTTGIETLTGYHTWSTVVTGTSDKLYRDGREIAYGQNSLTVQSKVVAPYQVGRSDAVASPFGGGIQAVAIYSDQQSAGAQFQFHQAWRNYATSQGIAWDVPLNYSTDSTAIIEGDSIKAGVNPGVAPDTQWSLDTAFTTKKNNAVTGTTCVQILGKVQYLLRSQIPIGGSRNLVILEPASNDLSGGVSAANTENCMASLSRLIKLYSPTTNVMIDSVIDRLSMSTAKNGYNFALAQNYFNYADYLCDVGRTVELGKDGQNADTTYFNGDKVHPNLLGSQKYGTYESNCINALYGNRTWATATTTSTTPYTELAKDVLLIIDTSGGAKTVNGITAQALDPRDARCVWAKGANAVTYDPAGSETADGAATKTVSANTIWCRVPVPASATSTTDTTGGANWVSAK